MGASSNRMYQDNLITDKIVILGLRKEIKELKLEVERLTLELLYNKKPTK